MPLLVSTPGINKVTLFRLPEKEAYANLNTAVFDRSGNLFGSRATPALRPARSEVRRHHGVQGSRGRGTLWNDGHTEGRRLVRLARRQSYCQDRSCDRNATIVEPHHAQSGRAARVVGFQGRVWSANGTAATYRCRSRRLAMESLEAAATAPYLCGLRRRQDKVWLTDFAANAIVRFDPLTEKFNVFAAIGRTRMCGKWTAGPGEAWAVSPAPTGWW